MRDRIEEIDDQARRFRYLRTHHPFSVSFYKGTILVRDAGDGQSEVTWAIELDVAAEARDELVPFAKAVLSDGIAGLERDLQKERTAS
jgi:Polyketide cyclase / dehydrase and lipid transport